MKRWERWSFNATTVVVAMTGLMYLWMKYFVQNTDPFAVVNHPWQSAMLHAHVLAAPMLILVFGLVLNSHILKKLGATRLPNRRSGLISLGLFAVMLVSGYSLQVVTSEQALHALVIVHVGSGALFSLAYGVHLVLSWQLGRPTAARSRMREAA